MEHWENGGLKAIGPLHLLFPLPRDQKWFIGSDKSVECNCFDFSFLVYQHQGHWLPDIVEGIGPGENVRDSIGGKVSLGDLDIKPFLSFPTERQFSQYNILGGIFGQCLKVTFLEWTKVKHCYEN